MEILGGLMVMLSILGFLAVVAWILLPFAVFAMKVKLDGMTQLLEEMNARLQRLEERRPDRSGRDARVPPG